MVPVFMYMKTSMTHFIDQLKTRTEKLIIGNPMDMETQIGALISKEHLSKVLEAIELAKQSGATLLTGGYQVTDNGLAKTATLLSQPCLWIAKTTCLMFNKRSSAL